MKATRNIRRLGGSVAIMATAFAGVGMVATPASAASAASAAGPTTTVQLGVATVTGTAGRDVLHITVDGNGLSVDVGFDGTVETHIPRSQFRELQVLGRAGDDGITVTGTGVVPTTINGGVGNDFIGALGSSERGDGDAATIIRGQDGNDDVLAATPGPITITTGAGDDTVEGGLAGIGQEHVSLGDGNDRFVSSLNAFVGARHDIVDGGLGKDGMEIRGSFASESLNLVQKNGRLIVEHSADEIDSDNIEGVSWIGFGGLDESGAGDSVTVGDLTGTDVGSFSADFTDPLDNLGPNNSADQLRIVGTSAVDNILASSFDGTIIDVVGLHTAVSATNLDHKDTLRIDTLAGRDIVDHAALPQGLVQLQVF